MNSPNYPPQGGQQGPYGPPQGQPQGQPYGQRPPQTPPGGQPYGGPPPQTPPGGQPYGGPPPQGQPYPAGPAGPGGPTGPPPAGYPAAPTPPPASKPKASGKIIKIVVGVAVVGLIVFLVSKFWGTSAKASEVGDCIKINDVAKADVSQVECNSAEAAYKVAFKSGDSGAECPGGQDSSYLSYTEEGSVLLCLTLNVKEGDCIIQSTADTIVPCTDPKATLKVSKILKDTTDYEQCGDDRQDAYVYADPKMVQCFVKPDGGGQS